MDPDPKGTSKKKLWTTIGVGAVGLTALALAGGAGSQPTAQPTTAVVVPQEQQASVQPITATPDPSSQVEAQDSATLSNDSHYTNVDGASVHSPAYSSSGCATSGATAECGDGTCSFSQHHSGTCSHHGGVAEWL